MGPALAGGGRLGRLAALALRLRLGGSQGARQRRAHRGGLRPRATSRPRTTATARSPRGRRGRRRAAPSRRRPRAGRDRLHRQRLVHRLHDSGGRRLRRRRARPGPAPRRLPITEAGCAGGVVGLARAARLPRRASRPRRARPGPRVRRASRSSAGTARPRTSSRPRSSATAAPRRCSSARSTRAPRAALVRIGDRESSFFPGTTHLMGFRPAQPGPADHPRQGARPVRATRGRAARSRTSCAPAASTARGHRALDPPPRRPAHHRGDGGAARPRARATSPPPRRSSPRTAT